MAVKNSTIIAKTWLECSSDFHNRIPDPTVSGIESTAKALFDPMNRRYFEEFTNTLLNRIGEVVIHDKRWTNKLKPFRGTLLNYGNSVQEIATKWIKAHAYKDDQDTLQKVKRPEFTQWFHSENRRMQYHLTVNEIELRRAFTSPEGLANLVSTVLTTALNADEYDTFLIMVQLLAEYDKVWGFHRVSLPEPKDITTAREFSKQIQILSENLQYPTTLYNNIDVPVFANPDELILITTPTVMANVTNELLANTFHEELARIGTRVVTIGDNYWPIPNTYAILTTPDFFVCRDTLAPQTTSWFDPQNLQTQYWYTHMSIESTSPFVPAILFTTEEGTNIPTVKVSPTGLNVTADPTSIEAGETAQLKMDLDGSVTSEDGGDTSAFDVRPDACTFEVSTDGEKPLNTRTFVDDFGVLHTQKTLDSGDTLTVKCTSAYTNPSGKTTEYTDTVTITIK